MNWVGNTADTAVNELTKYGPIGLLCIFLCMVVFFMGVVVIVLWKAWGSEREAHSQTKDKLVAMTTTTLTIVNELRSQFDAAVDIMTELGKPRRRS